MREDLWHEISIEKDTSIAEAKEFLKALVCYSEDSGGRLNTQDLQKRVTGELPSAIIKES
jgi:hypothetical protein